MALYVNKPADWSSQDLGWALPNSDFRWAASTAGRARMGRVLDRVAASGSNLIRTDLYWAGFQNARSDARAGWSDVLGDTAFLDDLFDGCETRGIYIVGALSYSPAWANGNAGNDKVPPLDPTDYANAAWLIANRYQARNPGVLIMFEWWNEPNISAFWKDPASNNGPNVARYTQLMIAASKAVRTGVLVTPSGTRSRAAHPEIMVANGGLSPAAGNGAGGGSYSPLNFVKGIVTNGGASWMDALCTHPYMWICPATEVVAWNPMVQLSDCLAWLKANGGPLDAWCTEAGVISRPDSSGTDPTSYDCGAEAGGVGGPSGGYSGAAGHIAPGGGTYNTSDRAVDDTTAAARVASYVQMWRSTRFYDTDPVVNRQVTGPFFVFRLNDQAATGGSIAIPPTLPRTLPQMLSGVTLDRVDGTQRRTDELAAIRGLPVAPITRINIDPVGATNPTVDMSNYTAAFTLFKPYSYIMVMPADSTTMKKFTTVTAYGDYFDVVLDAVETDCDIVEIGNECGGDWLFAKTGTRQAQQQFVADKVTEAYNRAKTRGKKVALTLWENNWGTNNCGDGTNWEMTPQEFSALLSPTVRAGIDYLFISWYATQCTGKGAGGNLVPSSVIKTEVQSLRGLYINAKVGFGELGLPNAIADQSQPPVAGGNYDDAQKIAAYYYGLGTLGLNYFCGGYFWWYFAEDCVPKTDPFWGVIHDAMGPGPTAGAWTNDEDHYGVYEYGTDATDGPAKPFATAWTSRFTNTGGPQAATPDTVPPVTSINSVAGVDVTTHGGQGFPIGFATGAGIPTNAEMDEAKAIGADFIRCGVTWDAGSSVPDRNFDKPNPSLAAIAYANSIDLPVVLQIGSGPTYNGSMYTHDFNGVDVVVEFSKYAAAVIRAFCGAPGASNWVMAVEILNECNHAKINDPFLDDGVTANPHFIQWTGAGATGPQRYAEIFLRIVHADWENVLATSGCPPIVTTGLGGESDRQGISAFDFTVAVHQTLSFGGHTYTGGLWPTAGGANPWYAWYNLHPYSRPLLPSQDIDGGWASMISHMAWFQANRGRKPPLIITEFGQGTLPENTTTCQHAADSLADAVNLLIGYVANDGWDLRGFAWFTMMDNNKPNLPPGAEDNSLGVVHWNADPRVATPKPILYDKYVQLATAGPAPPTVPTVTGASVVIQIAAADNVGVSRVDQLVDGIIVGPAAFAGSSYAYTWDSTSAANGPHALRSKVTDLAGNVTLSPIVNVIVDNPDPGTGPDVAPPVVSIVNVSDGQLLAGTAASVIIHATDLIDPSPLTQILVDGQIQPGLPIRTTGAPSGWGQGGWGQGGWGGGTPDTNGDYYLFYIDTTRLTSGAHTLRGISTDASGNIGSSPLITFFVDNGVTPTDEPPVVYLTFPSTDALVSGSASPFNAFGHDDIDAIIPTVELWVVETGVAPTVQGFTLGVSELGGPDPLGGGVGVGVGGAFTGAIAGDATINPLRLLGRFMPTGTDMYLLLFDTFNLANGDYQVAPKAIDSGGNVAWGPAIHILVQNVVVPVQVTVGSDQRFPYRVYVRDGDTWKRLAPVSLFTKLDLTFNENAVGAWTLEIEDANRAVPYLLYDHAGIVVYKQGQVMPVFSGDVTNRSRKWDLRDRWTFTGVDDNSWLADALAHPAPSETPDVTGRYSQSYDIRSGPSESLLLAYIDANIGPSAIAARRIPGLTLSIDQGRGNSSGPWRARWNNLLTLLQKIAVVGPGTAGFRILTHDHPVATVYFPADRHLQVRFATQLGKLKSFAYEDTEPDANVIYAAGIGTGANREFVVASDPTSIASWRRRETFTDHADAADLGELAELAGTDLAENRFVPTLALEPKDATNTRFIDDYNLGDVVTVVLPERIAFIDRIVSITITLDGNGVTVKPAAGATPRDALRVISDARRLRSEVRNLQRT